MGHRPDAGFWTHQSPKEAKFSKWAWRPTYECIVSATKMSALRIPCVSEVASTSPRCIPQLAARRSLSRRAGRRATTQVLNCAVNPRSTPSINVAAALEAPTASRLASPAGVAPAAGSGGFNSDILGLGQAIVDWSASVDFSLLSTFNVPLGGRR